mmetsp:Transcript_9160/g.10174  ORF Transcript_9160/g.10174 Transcript_9160/m.10174 type:complete len:172 (-) Transcript_9160:55-570(-)
MGKAKGFRSKCRQVHTRPRRDKGYIPLSTYMQIYKRGEYVDIVTNPAQQKGMPHRHYHGKTGRIFAVSPRAVGVELYKRIDNYLKMKKVWVRIEHVRPSKCLQDYHARREAAKILRRQCQLAGTKFVFPKRTQASPKSGKQVFLTGDEKINELYALKYDWSIGHIGTKTTA